MSSSSSSSSSTTPVGMVPFPSIELQSLHDFYLSLHGDEWLWTMYPTNRYWNFSQLYPQPCQQYWVGVYCNAANTTVTRLALYSFNLVGTIPLTIHNLKNMTVLDLHDNAINGTIPSTITNMTSLTKIILYLNNFEGSIPSDINKLLNLQYLYLYNNFLTGKIPLAICKLIDLRLLMVSLNRLTGSIPSCIGQCNQIIDFYIDSNFLTGSIPSSIANLTSIHSLLLENNRLSGTLPRTISTMNWLSSINLEQNLLSGTLDNLPIQMTKLASIDLSNNQFTGSFPFTNWTKVNGFILANNYLSSSLPSSFVNNKRITYLNLVENLFTGKVFEEVAFGTFHRLGFIYLQQNLFSGSLLALNWTELVKLNTLSLYQNQFTGSLPSLIGNGNSMHTMKLLFLQSNQFTGTLPSTLSKLYKLKNLLLQNNQFSGNIEMAINPLTMTALEIIDISNNQFTGTIPTSYFVSLPHLTTIAFASNCFHGSLPVELCDSKKLQEINLDGLSTAENCRIPIWHSLESVNQDLDAFLLEHTMVGSIPSCYFTLPKVQILHLSGNGLTGTLPHGKDFQLPGTLVNISLSHNQLTGTIPLLYYAHHWKQFDLSYNKFTGKLHDFMNHPNISQMEVSLDVNRLSGPIPSQYKETFASISILNGNMFQCDVSRSTLPSQDPVSKTYSCGSDATNNSIFLYLLSFILPIGIIVVVFWKRRARHGYANKTQRSREGQVEASSRSTSSSSAISMESTSSLSTIKSSVETIVSIVFHSMEEQWQQLEPAIKQLLMDQKIDASKASPPSLRLVALLEFPSFLQLLRRYLVELIVALVLTMIPIYAILTSVSTMYEYQYIWKLSATLITGKVPGSMLMLFFCIFLTFVIIHADRRLLPYLQQCSDLQALLHKYGVAHHAEEATETKNEQPREKAVALPQREQTKQSPQGRYLYSVWTLTCLLNTFIMVMVDGLYVYIFLNYVGAVVIIAQITLAIIKIVWNDHIIFWVFYYMKHGIRYLVRAMNQIMGKEEEDQHPEDSSPSSANPKLYEVLLADHDVNLLAMIAIINKIVIPCVAISFVNSNCFYYAVVSAPAVTAFYENCLDLGPVTLCYNLLGSDVDGVSYEPPFLYSYQCSAYFVADYTPVFIYMCAWVSIICPTIFFVAQRYIWKHQCTSATSSRLHSTLMILCNIILPLGWKSFQEVKAPSTTSTMLSEEDKGNNDGERGQAVLGNTAMTRLPIVIIHNKHRFMIRMTNHLAILLSFGILFPPLAIIVFISMVILLHLELKNSIRFLHEMLIQSQETSYLLLYAEECYGVMIAMFRPTLPIILFFASILLSTVLFDTFGDENGYIIACIPTLLFYLYISILYVVYTHRQMLLAKYQSWIGKTEATSLTAAGEPRKESNDEDDVDIVEVTNPINAYSSRLSTFEIETNE